MITKISIFIIMVFAVLSQNAVAAEPESSPPIFQQQKLGEVYIRQMRYCSIHKLIIDDNTYIVNTCGGIVLVPEG